MGFTSWISSHSSPTPTSVHCPCDLLPPKKKFRRKPINKTKIGCFWGYINCISLFFSPASKPPIYPPLLSFKFNSNSNSTSYHCTQIWICIYTNILKHSPVSPHNAICMCDFRVDFLTLDMFGQWCWWDFMSLMWLRNSLRAKHLILRPWNLSFPSFPLLPEPWV